MLRRLLSPLAALFLLAMNACSSSTPDLAATSAPTNTPPPETVEHLIVGAGCFWCVEAAYELVPGVLDVVSGYAGGDPARADYESVCTGETGHAEVVRITFDPARVSRRALLDYFWDIHDPTTLNRQGADVGTQYRSVIYYANNEEKALVLASRDQAGRQRWGDRIVTEISPLPPFFPAEAYHQDYFRKNPYAGYCRYVIKPKVEKLLTHPLVRPEPNLTPAH